MMPRPLLDLGVNLGRRHRRLLLLLLLMQLLFFAAIESRVAADTAAEASGDRKKDAPHTTSTGTPSEQESSGEGRQGSCRYYYDKVDSRLRQRRLRRRKRHSWWRRRGRNFRHFLSKLLRGVLRRRRRTDSHSASSWSNDHSYDDADDEETTTKAAYTMAVLSQLAYWDYVKRPLQVDGFRLVVTRERDERDDDTTQNIPPCYRIRIFLCRVLRRGKIGLVLLRRNLSNALLNLPHNNHDSYYSNCHRIARNGSDGVSGKNNESNADGIGTKNDTRSFQPATAPASSSCLQNVLSSSSNKEKVDDRQRRNGIRYPKYQFNYWLYNWYEPTALPNVNFHDTDVLVSMTTAAPVMSSDRKTKNHSSCQQQQQQQQTLVLAFAGTASASDAFTSMQTFERANHSSTFGGIRAIEKNNSERKQGHQQNITIEGSLHRGFLNAYSRVERGNVVRLVRPTTENLNNFNGDDGDKMTVSPSESTLMASLDRRFGHCLMHATKNRTTTRPSREGSISNSSKDYDNTSTTNVKRTKNGVCRARGERLGVILRELVTDAVRQGHTVHITGHSLGGAIGALLALDVVVNFPQVPVSNLYLWTFGAPQVADDVFLRSAMEAAPRLRPFVSQQLDGGIRRSSNKNNNGRFRRYVTISDDCNVDFVSSVAERTVRALRRGARRIGGVHGEVVHFSEPHYILTPEQYLRHDAASLPNDADANENTTAATLSSDNKRKKISSNSTTGSAIDAHALANYLLGISRESEDHPLTTDLPEEIMQDFLGGVTQDEQQGRQMTNRSYTI